MKIKKLLTLSQFVDYVIQIDSKELIIETDYNYTSRFELSKHSKLILMYSDFLKQPLKKEMFVNEIEYPDESLSGGFATNEEQNQFNDALIEWQEAEKKVIFDNYEFNINRTVAQYTTLNGLAIMTLGKIDLKNVEL